MTVNEVTPTTEHKVTIDDLIDGWACEHMRADDRLEDVREAAKKALADHDRKIAAEAWDGGFTRGFYAAQTLPSDADASEYPVENPYDAARIEKGDDQ